VLGLRQGIADFIVEFLQRRKETRVAPAKEAAFVKKRIA
jgi:branched-chain amino acid transport system permease protein